MNKNFAKDTRDAKKEQINFRVTFNEKVLLTLMLKNGELGDFLRGRVLTSMENLKFCQQKRDEAKGKYEKFLSDLEKLDYEELAFCYEDEFATKWAHHFEEIKSDYECEHEQDESGYLTNDDDIRQFLIHAVTEQMKHYYAFWNCQYTNAYLSISEELIKNKQELSKMPKPE